MYESLFGVSFVLFDVLSANRSGNVAIFFKHVCFREAVDAFFFGASIESLYISVII